MCGITGIVGANASEKREALARMMTALVHRGPDGNGVYCSPSGYCLLGHRRLAILDPSDIAAQPMELNNGRYTLCYNGECYNFIQLRAKLIEAGYQFLSSGDTEVVLKMLEHYGKSCLSQLNGMFALGFWNENSKKLLLARDRFGQKPLYYFYTGKLLVFASELRALLASGLTEKKVNLQALKSYLAYGAIHGEETIVSGISILPASSFLEWELNHGINIYEYWEPEKEKRNCAPQRLRRVFAKAVERHLMSDVPIGTFLSGGIDSSAVVAAAVRATEKKITSVSAIFPDFPQISEQVHAQRMAALAGTNHVEVPLTESAMLNLLPNCLNKMDQPTIDSFNTFVVSHAAREIGLKVVLSGLGGDELFGGYPSFRDIPRLIRLKRAASRLDKPIGDILSRIGSLTKKGSKSISILTAANDVLNLYLIRRQLFSNGQIGKLIPGVEYSQTGINISQKFEQLLRNIIEERDIHDQIGLLEMFSYMGQTLLRDVDITGMAHSLEIRMPFLDTQFTDTALALPSAVRAPTTFPKEWFVAAMNEWLPAENTQRTKQGFSLPFSYWMQKTLRPEIEDGLNTLVKTYSLFEQTTIKTFWKRFLQNPQAIGWSRPWSLYVLGQYLHSNGLVL